MSCGSAVSPRCQTPRAVHPTPQSTIIEITDDDDDDDDDDKDNDNDNDDDDDNSNDRSSSH